MVSMPSLRNVLERYCDEIQSGAINVGALERGAVDRYVREREIGYWQWDQEAADRACHFFPSYLVHTKGRWAKTDRRAAQAFKLSPFQVFIVANLMGWKDPVDGLRRFRKAYISLARKQGKSFTIAGLTVYFFMRKDDPQAEIYTMGANLDQAKILFNMARSMIAASPSLRQRCTLGAEWVINNETGAVLVPLACGPAHGKSPSIVVYDEVHEYQNQHRGSYDALATGSGAREAPLHISITTSGDPAGGSPIWEEEDTAARKVVEAACTDNPIGERDFVFVARYDKGDDFLDPQNFRKANPNLGVTVLPESLELERLEAKTRPERMHRFKRFFCNYPIGSKLKAVDAKQWQANVRKEPDFSGAVCYGGLDAGRNYDFAGFALVFPLDDDTYYLKAWTWASRQSDAKTDREPFTTWEAQRHITIHDGDAIDFTAVRDDISEILRGVNCVKLTFDKHEAHVTATDIQLATGVPIEEMPQSYPHYNESLKKFVNSAVPDGEILHNGDPVLAWQADNLSIKRDPRGLWMPDKAHKERKIDAMVAGLMAYKTALFHENQSREFYLTNEVEVG